MDFRAAYASLTELFPQVDSRVLKAAAIEHSNDVHAAVEFIIYEVLPSISVPYEAYSTVHSAHEVFDEVQLKEQDANNQGAEAAQPELILCETAISGDSAGSPSPGSEKAKEPIIDVDAILDVEAGDHYCVSASSGDDASSSSPFRGKAKEPIIDIEAIIDVEAGDHYCVSASSGDDASSSSPFRGKAKETIIDVEAEDLYSSVSVVAEHRDLGCYNSFPEDIERSVSECDEQLSRCSVNCSGTVSAALESTHNISSVDERSMESVMCGAETPKDVNGSLDETKEYHSRCLAECHSDLLACDTEMVSLGERDLPMLISTWSGHVVNIDLLEECVTDAKSSKKTLVSAVESVVTMSKEAEHLEQRVKQAKEESFSAGQDILNKAEELKKMLQHAKQANEMHAGEVYGEKSILSTEARELQSRLLNLSDERTKSFATTEEIREALEPRLAAAKDGIAAAEQEKLEKEELAQKALKEQERIMDTIVQESKKLQKEAEENAKLREFLVDRGRVVDTLQGEITVICEDVLLLKKRVEERAPLKGSLLMSTYSSTSSSSSFCHESATSAEQIDENTRRMVKKKMRSHEVENIITFSSMEDTNASGYSRK